MSDTECEYPVYVVMCRSSCYDPVVSPLRAFWRLDHAERHAARLQALEEYEFPLYYVETCDVEPDHG